MSNIQEYYQNGKILWSEEEMAKYETIKEEIKEKFTKSILSGERDAMEAFYNGWEGRRSHEDRFYIQKCMIEYADEIGAGYWREARRNYDVYGYAGKEELEHAIWWDRVDEIANIICDMRCNINQLDRLFKDVKDRLMCEAVKSD